MKFVAEDDHIWHFDDTWNISIGDFTIQNMGGDKLRVSFSFEADVISISEDGHSTLTIPHEGLDELQPHLERLETLLDLLTLHSGIPLSIEDGSLVFRGAGYTTNSNPVTNTKPLHDVSGLEARFTGLTVSENDVANALRFFRLSLLDKDYNGKAVKLWATLEALYKGYEKSEETICKKLTKKEKNEIRRVINSQEKLSDEEKKRLIDALFVQKLSSKSSLLSKKLNLMNSSGDYKEEEIRDLVAWWSDARNAPSHGERIKRDDEDRKDAVDDFEDTAEMLLQSSVNPSMHAYFIGHPKDVERGFWNKNDSTITKFTDDCWVKPTEWGTYLLEHMGKHKVGNNAPLLYVSHNKVYELSPTGNTEVTDIESLPQNYRDAVIKTQSKLIS